MTLEEFQTIGRGMIMEARIRFRDEAMRLCHSDAERAQAQAVETAIGEVSPEEAVLAFKRWLDEGRAAQEQP